MTEADSNTDNHGGLTIKLDPLFARPSPLGFHQYAKEFLRAARAALVDQPCYTPAAFFGVCRSVELLLKAFLLAEGWTVKKVKGKLGHDLKKALRKARSQDAGGVLNVSQEEEEAISKANGYYMAKGFEYFDASRLVKDLSDLPSLPVLFALADRLLVDLESLCLDAWDKPPRR